MSRGARYALLALIGLTVNPAILLVDRMQQRAWRGGLGAGAAALAADGAGPRIVDSMRCATVKAKPTGCSLRCWKR